MNTYKKNYIIVLMLILFAACSPSSQDNGEQIEENKAIDASAFVGMWSTDKDVYNFYEDGRFETVNDLAISGYSWKIEGNKLILSFLDSPANKAKDEIYEIDTVRTARLILIDKDNTKIILDRSKEKIYTAKAKLFYRERIALPPEVIVHYQLTQDKGTKVINSGYYSYKGSIPISFNALCLEEDIDKTKAVELIVTLYYKDNALFSTKTPVTLDATIEQDILLQRATNEEIAPTTLTAPMAFEFTQDAEDALYSAQLFLEDKHLFFLIQERDEKNDGITGSEAFITWGYWKQVGRGHSIELIVAGKETLTGAVSKQNEISFDKLPLFDKINNIKFALSTKKMDEKTYFTLKGEVTKKNNEFHFIPNGLTDSFKLLGNVLVNPELSALANNKKLYIELNASYAQEGFFDVQNIISTSETKVNEEKYEIAPLKNTYWRLTELNGKEKINNSPAEPHFILNIEDLNSTQDKAKTHGKGAGSDGCNSFFFSWENAGEKLDIVLGGSTMRLCAEEGVDVQAREFLQALDKTDSFIIQGSSLELRQNGKELATFEAVAL